MTDEPTTETRFLYLAPEKFIEDPALFGWVEKHFRAKNWYALLGEWPIDNRVMATIPPEGGVKFFWRHADNSPPHEGG